MTNSITINYNEADAPRLFGILNKKHFRQLSAKTVVFEPVPTKAEFIAELKASVEWVNAHRRGEVEAPSFEASMALLKKELVEEGYEVL